MSRKTLTRTSSSTRFWAPPWRRRAEGESEQPGRAGPRIAVLGNCQAHGVAQALRLILPEARISLTPMAFLARDHGSLGRLRDHLDGFDHVFSHFFPVGFIEGGNVHDLAGADPRFRLFPTILFPAFHPDMIYVGEIGALSAARLVSSPVGPYHSAIAICAHLEGLRLDATLALFTDATYARLGYHAAWDEACAHLLAEARNLAFPLEADLARWARRGCFMHGINHPKLFVLADIARRLAAEAGLAPLDVAAEDYLEDDLVADAIWPVYPELAERYGLSGSTLFKSKGRGEAFPALFDLPGFVAASFALYAAQPREALASARVEAWRADPAARAVFA